MARETKLKVGQTFRANSRRVMKITRVRHGIAWAVSIGPGGQPIPGKDVYSYDVTKLIPWLERSKVRQKREESFRKKELNAKSASTKRGKSRGWKPPKPFSVGGTKISLIRFVPELSAHKLPIVERTLSRCVALTKKKWKWSPKIIHVDFKTLRRGRMGEASGSRPIIRFSHMLMSEYKIKAFERTVLHELAHLANNDKHPARPGMRRQHKGHDDTFCTMLKGVDPVVRDQKTCQFFNDSEA